MFKHRLEWAFGLPTTDGQGLAHIVAASKIALTKIENVVTEWNDSVSAEECLEIEPYYRDYPILRLVKPIGSESPQLYLKLVPTYLILAPRFVGGMGFGSALQCSVQFIAFVMGLVESPEIDIEINEKIQNTDIAPQRYLLENATKSELEINFSLDSDFIESYRTIDGESLLEIAIMLDQRASVDMLLRTCPGLFMAFNRYTKSNFLSYLCRIHPSERMTRTVASFIEEKVIPRLGSVVRESRVTNPSEITSLFKAFALDILVNDGKGIKVLESQGFVTKDLFAKIGRWIFDEVSTSLSMVGTEGRITEFIVANP